MLTGIAFFAAKCRKSRQGMHIIEDAFRPGSRVILEADPDVGTCVVKGASLYDLGAILL